MNLVVTHWLPGKLNDAGEREPAQPCPDLLTAEEAVRYLRLDETGVNDPELSLRRYRESGRVQGVRMGKRVMYRRVELERFIESEGQSA